MHGWALGLGKGTRRAAEALGLLSGGDMAAEGAGWASALCPEVRASWAEGPTAPWMQRRTSKAPWNLQPLRDEGGAGMFYVKEGRPCAESHHVKSCAG